MTLQQLTYFCAFFRKVDAVRRVKEKGNVELFLQLMDGGGNRRLGNVEGFRCADDAVITADGAEISELL